MPYLMDDIEAAAEAVKKTGQQRDPVLRIYPDMQFRLKAVPRFLLDDAAIATAVELTLGRPKVLLEAMANCRVPYPAMWIEWLESGREKLRQTFGGEQGYLVTKERPLPKRLGFLIEADHETGRRGYVTWAWNGVSDYNSIDGVTFPNVATISPYYDLDQRRSIPAERIEGFLRGNLAKIWKDNPVQMEALNDIWRTAEHKPNAWGEEYLETIYNASGPAGLRKAMGDLYADVYGEYIIVWGIILLLTSNRQVVRYEGVDRSKINRVRAKRREVPLLDHTQVTLILGDRTTEAVRRQPLSYRRKSPRIHMVSSFLNRRGDKHWVVAPFWRGSGDLIHREVKVRG